ncbi:helix-turn-helix domain-containing protein [Microbacterium sp. Leaf347]|jgi:transcriptional regulator with XRE-family HTH domain|uniref:helix-turn-helix domain-containing protein n=2 Tax=Microbacterium TaxID=33882 RepID=UPI0009EB8E2C|nr:helix-turn-helix transcriptional regulator [Microbacterium sp. Leaf347]
MIQYGDNVSHMDKYVEAAAAELRAAQARARMSDVALAAAAGIPAVTLRRYLKGERDAPLSVLFKIADALGVSAGGLLDDAMKHVKD